MATFEERFYLEERGFFRRFWRDLCLLHFLAMGLVMWATKGRRLKQAYRAKKAAGQKLWLD